MKKLSRRTLFLLSTAAAAFVSAGFRGGGFGFLRRIFQSPGGNSLVDGSGAPIGPTMVGAPVVGTYSTGDIVINSPPAFGQPWAYECQSGGTPGTWGPIGTIANVNELASYTGTITADLQHYLTCVGTLDTTAATTVLRGVDINLATAGANAVNMMGQRVFLSPGYTGSGIVRALYVQNNVVGTNKFSPTNEGGIIGASLQAQYAAGGSTGDRVGAYCIANGGQFNVAVFGRSIEQTAGSSSSSNANVGVAGVGGHFAAHGTQTQIGGFFAPGAGAGWYTDLDNASNIYTCAIMADTNGETAEILIGRNNHVTVITINQDGSITLNGSSSGSCQISVPAAAGTGTKFVLPPNNGSPGQKLTTDGAGNLTWT